MATLASSSRQVVAYHFCQSDNAPTCLVPEFVHSVAAQMSQAPQLTPYFRLVSSDPRLQALLSLAGCVADPSAALVSGVLEPLAALAGAGRLPGVADGGGGEGAQRERGNRGGCGGGGGGCGGGGGDGGGGGGGAVVVVDGLCDAEVHRVDHGGGGGGGGGVTLGSLLASHLHRFPPWLKVVCTVRSNSEAASEVTRALPFQRISLDKTDVDERLNKVISAVLAHPVLHSHPVRLG